MKPLYMVVFLMSVLFSEPVFALRCGHFLVQTGDDYKADVYDKCGEPDSVESHYERRGNMNHADINQFNRIQNGQNPNNPINYGQAYYQEEEVFVEEWIYNFGSSRLRKLLRFENGRLIQIIDLGRGRYRR